MIKYYPMEDLKPISVFFKKRKTKISIILDNKKIVKCQYDKATDTLIFKRVPLENDFIIWFIPKEKDLTKIK